jgi:hypothetical protein
LRAGGDGLIILAQTASLLERKCIMFESLFGRRHRPAAKSTRRPHRRTLTVEALEDRCVPTAITYIQDIGTALDTTSGNTTLSIPVKLPVAAGHDIFIQVVYNWDPTTEQDIPKIADSAGNRRPCFADLQLFGP